MTTDSITVLLVDDHPVVRAGIKAVLNTQAELEILAEAATGEEALELAADLHPQVVLCDLQLGAGISGIETTAQLVKLSPTPKVLMLTTFDREADITAAMQAGASGYLLKDADPNEIAQAVLRAARGETILAPELLAKMMHAMRTPSPKLTERELEVLKQLNTGKSNQEVAKELFVSLATVKTHIQNIFNKLDVDSRAKALHVARERGIL